MLRAYSGEATITNFIVLGLTRTELEPTIYRTRGEHANHYTTNAVYNSGECCIQSYEMCCNFYSNDKDGI